MAKNDDDEKLLRKHIIIYEDDWNWIKEVFGDKVGISKAIRTMVRSYRRQIEEKARGAQPPAPKSIDI